MKILLATIGFLGFLGSLAFLWVGGSVFADFRTENITGPGVDVRVIDKYPSEDGVFRFDVVARGGSKAAIGTATIVKDGVEISRHTGRASTGVAPFQGAKAEVRTV